MSQYDLLGDAAQVGGLRCLDAAVGGRAAERLPVEHEVVDAGRIMALASVVIKTNDSTFSPVWGFVHSSQSPAIEKIS